jgi:glycosyltransferase involved in cell wall biosynthesis
LLKGMVLLKDHPARPHLLLIGTGELFEQTKAAAAALSIADRIHFIGTRPDARKLLAAVDVYVNPTRGEAFGLAVVEAMLAGKPVVVAKNGALPEYVVHDQTGLFFKPGDASGLAHGVGELLDDPERASRIGNAARQMALDNFSPAGYVEEITRFIAAATSGITMKTSRPMPADLIRTNAISKNVITRNISPPPDLVGAFD